MGAPVGLIDLAAILVLNTSWVMEVNAELRLVSKPQLVSGTKMEPGRLLGE